MFNEEKAERLALIMYQEDLERYNSGKPLLYSDMETFLAEKEEREKENNNWQIKKYTL